jgi:enamine deaminase RidA (YjgF/YER057c/UK114 family)
MISSDPEIILAPQSHSAKVAGPLHENQPESFRRKRRNRMEVENKLKAMGLELPAAGAPPPGRAGAVKIGNILFVGGHTPGPAYRGKLGAGFTVEQGYDGARQACLNCLADVKAVIGDLDKVKRVAKLLCMVNSAPDFGQQPLVANGATDLLRELYGDAGAHARSAVGLAALPNGACIEIEMILEVED